MATTQAAYMKRQSMARNDCVSTKTDHEEHLPAVPVDDEGEDQERAQLHGAEYDDAH